MTICIDLTSLADNYSGIERYASCIALELIKHQDSDYVLVFKNSIHKMFTEAVNQNNVRHIVLYGKNKLIFNQIILPFSLHKIKADFFLFLAFPIPLFCHKKNMIATVHDICCWDCPETMKKTSGIYFRMSQKRAMKKSKLIIAISNFTQERIRAKFGFGLDKKTFIVYCGINKQNFSNRIDYQKIQSKYSLPSKYLLSLSTIEPRKNLQLLIRAYSELLEERDMPKLVLAGRKGWKIDKIFDAISEKAKKNIVFTGFIKDDDLPTVYFNSLGFVFPSLYEGFGIPPLEAMACGTLVLSSDATSLPEVLGDAALYFKSNDIADLKSKLILMMEIDHDQKKLLVKKGLERVDCFDWKMESDKLYNKLVEMHDIGK